MLLGDRLLYALLQLNRILPIRGRLVRHLPYPVKHALLPLQLQLIVFLLNCPEGFEPLLLRRRCRVLSGARFLLVAAPFQGILKLSHVVLVLNRELRLQRLLIKNFVGRLLGRLLIRLLLETVLADIVNFGDLPQITLQLAFRILGETLRFAFVSGGHVAF